ncbi:unnamed protein product [Ceutorhynchus assimilis]|uniref:Uncharacterized protein n=1 Tax=Ceutorhynchus assimilis TaxID=467358 RepID=A0A9N9QLA7_9CUCU|nr:unnamed protein product [Ceutorhynchus assimilis]
MAKFLYDLGSLMVGIVAGALVGKYAKDIYTKITTIEDDDELADYEKRNYEVICSEDEDDCECEDEDY